MTCISVCLRVKSVGQRSTSQNVLMVISMVSLESFSCVRGLCIKHPIQTILLSALARTRVGWNPSILAHNSIGYSQNLSEPLLLQWACPWPWEHLFLLHLALMLRLDDSIYVTISSLKQSLSAYWLKCNYLTLHAVVQYMKPLFITIPKHENNIMH